MQDTYVHGYHPRESARLEDQASTLAELLHADTAYPPDSRVLEVGCGVGAQTLTLARNSPGAFITAIDIAEESLARARQAIAAAGIANVTFRQADLFALPFPAEAFDHLFVCFVLEHLLDPLAAIEAFQRVLKPGGTITVIEGDHGSTFFYPESAAARHAIQCQVELQKRAGGNALVGRTLFPLLNRAGFIDLRVSPRLVYVDGSRPALAEGFTRRTFTAMIEGIREAAVAAGLTESAEIDQGIRDLHRTAEPDGVFCYTFFKATATKGG